MPASKPRADRAGSVAGWPGDAAGCRGHRRRVGATASRVLNGSAGWSGRNWPTGWCGRPKSLRYVSNGLPRRCRATSTVVGADRARGGRPVLLAIAPARCGWPAEHDLLTMMASTFANPDREIDYVLPGCGRTGRAAAAVGSGFTSALITERAARRRSPVVAGGGRVACVVSTRSRSTTCSGEPPGAEQAASCCRAGAPAIGVVKRATGADHRWPNRLGRIPLDTVRAAGVECRIGRWSAATSPGTAVTPACSSWAQHYPRSRRVRVERPDGVGVMAAAARRSSGRRAEDVYGGRLRPTSGRAGRHPHAHHRPPPRWRRWASAHRLLLDDPPAAAHAADQSRGGGPRQHRPAPNRIRSRRLRRSPRPHHAAPPNHRRPHHRR